ncbi:MAG: hypothetical protein AAB368_10625, partial [bacterium]
MTSRSSSAKPSARLAVALLVACAASAGAAEYDQLWAVSYDNSAHSTDIAHSVALDAAGNVYVAGSVTRTDTGTDNTDLVLAKFSSAGELLWVRAVSTTLNDDAWGVAVSPQGDIYVAGSVTLAVPLAGTPYEVPVGYLSKYRGDGTVVWTLTFDGDGSGRSVLFAVAVDPFDGSVAAAGAEVRQVDANQRLIPSPQDDILTMKIAPDGHLLWRRTYDNPAAGLNAIGYGVAIDRSHNVIVTGYQEVTAANTDIVLIKYGADSTPLWVATYGREITNTDATIDVGWGVAVDESGSI